MAFGFGFSFPHALGGGFTPASLFSAGEQGAWYDPSDLTTLYQDSAGTTPVTAVEQAVGLMLDKSKGGVGTNGSKRVNLLTYSEQFDNAAWTKTNIGAFGSGSVANTSATTDPLGGNTADYITENTTNGGHGVTATAVATAALGTVFKFSVYAKKAQRSWLRLFLGGLPDSWFNLDNGTLGTVGAGITASISSAGNGWYLCSISGGISFSPVDAGIRINTANNETGYVGTDPTTSPNGIYIWGADLRLNSEANTLPAYQRITDTWYNTLPGNHAYQTASTSRPTLRARYNLLTYSEQFDNAAWSKGSTSITQNATTAPNGTTTADTLTEDNTNARHSCAQLAVFAANINLCASIYVKAKERTRYTVGIQGDVNHFVCSTFNLISEQVVSTYTGSLGGTHVSSTITAVGNGWYRCVVIGSVPNATFSAFQSGMAISNTFTPDGSGREVYQGDGTSGIYIWGADLRVANDGVNLPAYQRIAAATDYDVSGFPVYLDFCESFGGTNTDNSMLTNSIDFSGTDKMAVFAGVRKLSDAAAGMVAELSAASFSNAGSFNLYHSDSGQNYANGLRGLANSRAVTATTYTAPITNVINVNFDISASLTLDGQKTRVNAATPTGLTPSQSSSDYGGGNFGNYPLYIGRRNNSSLPSSMRLFSLIVRRGATSDALIASTETWVNGKTKAYG